MKCKYIFLTLLIAFSNHSQAKIIEVNNFSSIHEYVTKDSLVLLDIDDTLLLPAQSLGSDVWFIHRCKQLELEGMDKAASFDRALSEWAAIRNLSRVVKVEENVDLHVKSLQDSGLVVMGLTAQGHETHRVTTRQLLSLNMDLTKTAPSEQDVYFKQEGEGILYTKGILFTCGRRKGVALLRLLNELKVPLKHVVFINDKYENLKDVEEELESKGFNFIGLRYAYGDERVEGFNSEDANKEWDKLFYNPLECYRN